MNTDDAEFLKKLQAAFRIEAAEHLQAISSGLLELEKALEPARRSEIVSSIFREAHSLKGAARAVNAGEIESICQSLENVFSDWRRNAIVATPELFDPLHNAVNAVTAILSAAEGEAPGLSAEETAFLLAKIGAARARDGRWTNEVNSALEQAPHRRPRRRAGTQAQAKTVGRNSRNAGCDRPAQGGADTGDPAVAGGGAQCRKSRFRTARSRSSPASAGHRPHLD